MSLSGFVGTLGPGFSPSLSEEEEEEEEHLTMLA